jgi:hypothetical protein
MATYGISGTGTVPFTGWSPTLGVGAANQGSTSGNVQFNGLTQSDDQLASYFNRQPNRDIRQLLLSVMGFLTGQTATAPYTRIKAQVAMNDPSALGGLVPIEATNYINRVTTAFDVSALQALLNRTNGPATYPIDLSMNGGSAGIGGPASKVLW